MPKCQPGCPCRRHLYKGVRRDPRVGRRISAAMTGRSPSEETRRKISRALISRAQEPEYQEARHQVNRTHGMCRTLTYRAWDNMKQRCLNPRSAGYKRDGGAGVTVCDQWLSFSGFYADMGERPEGARLERVDPARGYEPGNCRWAAPDGRRG